MVAPPGCCEICQIAEVMADPQLQNRSVRITGRLQTYDAQQKIAIVSFQNVSMTVETQRLALEHLRLQVGSTYQFLGETYTKVSCVYTESMRRLIRTHYIGSKRLFIFDTSYMMMWYKKDRQSRRKSDWWHESRGMWTAWTLTCSLQLWPCGDSFWLPVFDARCGGMRHVATFCVVGVDVVVSIQQQLYLVDMRYSESRSAAQSTASRRPSRPRLLQMCRHRRFRISFDEASRNVRLLFLSSSSLLKHSMMWSRRM